jgi:hypothetical protein
MKYNVTASLGHLFDDGIGSVYASSSQIDSGSEEWWKALVGGTWQDSAAGAMEPPLIEFWVLWLSYLQPLLRSTYITRIKLLIPELNMFRPGVVLLTDWTIYLNNQYSEL